jgi:hypothetical protein
MGRKASVVESSKLASTAQRAMLVVGWMMINLEADGIAKNDQ